MQTYTTYNSPIGVLTLGAAGDKLCGIWIAGQKYHCDIANVLRHDTSVLEYTKGWLDCYFGKTPTPALPPMALEGTDFRRAIWQILQGIPYGSTTTYAQVAKSLSAQRGFARQSCRAVGGAIGHNPISILIPCHRVIGSNGTLTGYAGGLSIKQQLLDLERG
jgi:methylated-DNA-[protein]-cysteine S-methyltransferase